MERSQDRTNRANALHTGRVFAAVVSEGWSLGSVTIDPPDISTLAAQVFLHVEIDWTRAGVYFADSCRAWITAGANPDGPRVNVGWIQADLRFVPPDYPAPHDRRVNASEAYADHHQAGTTVPMPKVVGDGRTSQGHHLTVAE